MLAGHAVMVLEQGYVAVLADGHEFAYRHALAGKTGDIPRNEGVKLQLALGRLTMTELSASEHLAQMFFR